MSFSAATRSGTTSRTDVFNALRNQTIKIEGLGSASAAWSFETNPAVEQLRNNVNERLGGYTQQSLNGHHEDIPGQSMGC
jgi:hypothetical protein